MYRSRHAARDDYSLSLCFLFSHPYLFVPYFRLRFEEKKTLYEELKERHSRYKKEFKEVKDEAVALQRKAREEAPIQDEDGNPLPLKFKLDEDLANFNTVELAEAAKEEAERTLQDCVYNANALQQYKKNQEKIEDTTADLDDLRNRKARCVRLFIS